MLFEFADADINHEITNAKVTLINGLYKIKFSYKQAEGFLITAAKYNYNDSDIYEHISERFSSVENEKKFDEKNEFGFSKLILRANVGGGVELGRKSDFGFPLNVYVFAYEKNGDKITVYKQHNENNKDTLPYTIRYKSNFKSGFLGLKKAKEQLSIPYFESFENDLLYYSISGCTAKFPICETMLEHMFEVDIEKEGLLSLKVTEKYKSMFKCVREGNV